MAELSKARKFLEVLGYPYACGRVGRVAEKRPLSGLKGQLSQARVTLVRY